MTAFSFAKFLFDSTGEKKNPAEVSIYNALRRLGSEDTKLDEKELRKLFSSLLCFPYWRDKKAELARTFTRYWNAYSHDNFEARETQFSLMELEIFKLSSESNVHSFLVNHFSEIYPDSKIQVKNLRQNEFVCLILLNDKSLRVYHCNNEISMYKGKMKPLWEDFSLVYTPDLRLDAMYRQKMLVAPFRFLDLEKEGKAWNVYETQGYSLKHLRPRALDNLDEHSELFYQLKALESKFIQKSSDPLYLQITRSIEEIIEKVAENPEAHKDRAVQVYHKGRNAFENIFSDDRLLHLLLKELAMTIAAGRAKTWDEPEQENGEEWLKLNPSKILDSTNL